MLELVTTWFLPALGLSAAGIAIGHYGTAPLAAAWSKIKTDAAAVEAKAKAIPAEVTNLEHQAAQQAASMAAAGLAHLFDESPEDATDAKTASTRAFKRQLRQGVLARLQLPPQQ